MSWKSNNVLTAIMLLSVAISLLYTDAAPQATYLPLAPAQMSRSNWQTLEGCASLVQDWDEYSGKQDYVGRTVLRTKTFSLVNTEFIAEFRLIQEKSTYEILIKPHGDESCSRELLTGFFSAVKGTFGDPMRTVDLSYTMSQEDEHLDVIADWIFGKTRARLSYFGMTAYGKWALGLCHLTISDRNVSADLCPPVYLRLEGRKRLIGVEGKNEPTEIQPFLLIIDLNRERILRQNRNMFCTLTEVTEEFLVAKWDDDEFTHEFRINRRLGTFSWNFHPKSNKRLGMDVSG